MEYHEKYIGLVKWFYDQVRGANYGFIQHAKLGDIFFHERSLEEGQILKSFCEDAIVVFTIQESNKHKGKLEAVSVKHLDTETDLNFLFSHFLTTLTERGKYSDYNILQKGVHAKITNLLNLNIEKEQIENLFEQFKNYVNNNLQADSVDDKQYITGILKVCKSLFPENYGKIEDIVGNKITEELAHKLWIEGYMGKCQINIVATILLYEPLQLKQQVFIKCKEEEKADLYSKILDEFTNIDINPKLKECFSDEKYLKEQLKACKSFFTENFKNIDKLIEKQIPEELAHNLWLENYLVTCQVNYISNIILSNPKQTQKIILNKCTSEDKTNIFFKAIHNLEFVDTEPKLSDLKELLKLSKEFANEQHDKILDASINICPEYFRLNLWLEDYHNILDFNSYKAYTIALSPPNQKKFVKKVLKYIHEGKAEISIEELTSINVIDFKTSDFIEKNGGSYLDYSTSIILNVISELKKQTKLETRNDKKEALHRVYGLILKQIQEPKDILRISGYFDDCGGRCNVSLNEIKNEQGEVLDRKISYHRNEHKKAKNHPFCDGTKAIDRTTKEPKLSAEKVEYWWCANQKCFKPTRELHSSKDWEKYSLFDFLKILKVNFNECDFEIYLNIINKANRFLNHLKCRECNHILYPKGKSTYAFYGVNHFYCNTETCPEKGKEIYISHCLNGYCEMVIDSRDSVKCKPSGFDSDSCGWYVCNFCHACCCSQQLERRKGVIENMLHAEYKCHLKGHRDLGIISCNKCGDSMISKELNVTEYERILSWFITNKDKSERIHSSGKNRKFDKWWFVLKRGKDSYGSFKTKLNRYHQIGFHIPDLDQDKNLQLISEPTDFKKHSMDIFICQSCGTELDLSNDLERARAVKQYHNVKFVPNTINK